MYSHAYLFNKNVKMHLQVVTISLCTLKIYVLSKKSHIFGDDHPFSSLKFLKVDLQENMLNTLAV